MKKKYRCKVYWEVCGEYVVETDGSPEEAARLALQGNLPEGAEYVQDSENCDPETDVQEIKPLQQSLQPHY